MILGLGLGARAQIGVAPAAGSRKVHRVERGESAARALDAARREHVAMMGAQGSPRASSLGVAWTAVGPGQVLTGNFGKVTGRVTAIAIDPSDATGNTVYLGTTGGGVWKSTNAAGPVAAVTFAPLTDTLPVFSANAGTSTIASLSIGAVSVGSGVVLAGTGDPNDATDSYYGAGVLRSADAGATWTLAQDSQDGAAGNHSFFGLSFAGFAFSGVNPALVVAAVSQAAEGDLVNAADANNSVKGLYYSADAGVTWHLAQVFDGGQPVQTTQTVGGNAATAVVWNGVRQKFYAAVRFHGYYESGDGVTWTRLVHQPGAGLTGAACPANAGLSGSAACPIFRGALAVQAASGDLFALTVDAGNRDTGLYQDVCGLAAGACASASVQFAKALNGAALEAGNGSTVIAQGDYNLALSAVAGPGADTVLYVGTIDLYRCSVGAGCALRNTTNAANGCANAAGVAPAQHALASAGGILFLANDGGIYRSGDGANEAGPACSLSDAGHFENLNGGLGSLGEVVSFAQDPAVHGAVLVGLGALGTAGTGGAGGTGNNSAWAQLAAGEGGTVAIDPLMPARWFLSNGAGVSIAACGKGAGCAAADFVATVGEAQVARDVAAIHAPWLLDPAMSTNVIVGTCRAWRGPVADGRLWSSANAISRPFSAALATGCAGSAGVVRALGAGGAASAGSNAQNAGSTVIYAGMAGAADGGQGVGGHVFKTTAANIASNATVWDDVAKGMVANDVADAGVFNPGGFDISSVAVDAHDATGATVYATVMGFAGHGTNAPHVYRSTDAGGHWTNISSNLPNAPANSVVVDPNDANTLYVALDTGVYVTTQVSACASGNCWSIYGSALPNAPVTQLLAGAALPTGDGRVGELRAGTYGRGIWEIPLLTAISPAAPAISINPNTVTYSAQQVGTASASVTVTVTNMGAANLLVSSVVTSGDFSATNTCVGAAIAPGATCMAQVIFLPTTTGARAGLLTVYGNVAGGQGTATLSGTGTPPAAVVLDPVAMVFPATTVGAASAVQNLTISNTGGSVVTLQAPVVTNDYKIAANTCGTTLAASTGCTVSIAFAPTASGTRTGTFSVVDSAGTQVASLTGVGQLPATDALSPVALSFAGQQLGTTSAVQTVTLTNAGDVALTLIAAQTSGDFTVVNGCGNSLNAHASCALAVGFVPKSVGQGAGVLTVSDQFRSQTVALSGLGLAPAGVSLSPTNGLMFAATGVGLTAAAQTVTLTNNGGVPLAIASVAASGDFAVVPGSNTCGASLGPTAVCTVQVGFAPTVAGARSGTLTFVDSAGNSPQTLGLSGSGVDFALTVNGPATETIASGQTATYQLLLTGPAGTPGNAVFTCAGQPAHATCTVSPTTAVIAGSTVITVTVMTGLSTVDLQMPAMPEAIGQHRWWLAVLLPVMGFGVARRRRWRGAMVAVAMICVLGMGGCSVGRTLPGSGTGTAAPPVTPSGSSTLLVAGSSAGLVRSVSLTLIVK